MLSFALLESCGPDAWDPTGLRLCAGPFPWRGPPLLRAQVLFGVPPECIGPDVSAPTGRLCAGDSREQRPFLRQARLILD